MAFEEHVKRAVDSVTDRLRDEVERQLQAAMDEVSATARRETDEAKREVDAATRRADEAARDADTARRQAEEANRQADIANRQADEAKRLIDEANRLAEEARRQADDARAAIAAAPPPVEAPAAVDTGRDEQLLDAVRAMDGARSLTDVLDALLNAAAREPAGAGAWLLRNGRLRHWRSTRIDSPADDIALDARSAIADAARTRIVCADGEGCAVPLALAGEVVAVLYANGLDAAPHRRHGIELLARHAAKCLESITAFKTARAMADRAAPDHARSEPRGANGDAADPDDDVSAQRYARLLVSEIKLYHEQAVVEGRRDRDLATRLGGEIARARVMYELRVPAAVRQRANHFHDELVRTLAEGDASLLELRT